MNTIIAQSAEETQILAKEVISNLEGINLLCLYGNLGSGKTTFSQGIGKALGITNRMVSPTFVIVRKYNLSSALHDTGFVVFYHVDLYRVEKPEEIADLGILDFIRDQQSLVVIEWAERMGRHLPEKRIDIQFEYTDDEKRKITITKFPKVLTYE